MPNSLAVYRPKSIPIATRVAGVLAMLALMLHAIIPAGYMLGTHEKSGLMAITLCTSAGDVAFWMDSDGQIIEKKGNPQTPDDNDDSDAPSCAFAVHSASLQPPTPPQASPISYVYVTTFATLFSDSVAPGQGLAAPPPPKTGPPLQA